MRHAQCGASNREMVLLVHSPYTNEPGAKNPDPLLLLAIADVGLL